MRILKCITFILIYTFCSQISAAKPKRIALSFDDAPRGQGPMYTGTQRTDALIRSLDKAATGPVAFFVTTQNLNLDDNFNRIERYAEAGHLIANHTHTHPWLHKSDAQTYIQGIDIAESLLKGLDNRRPWFRFPYLDEGRTLEKRDTLRRALAKRELKNGYVTIDNYDWYLERKWLEATQNGQTVDLNALRHVYVDLLVGAVIFFDDLALKTLKRSPAHVLLLHENDLAALFIGDLVSELRKQGWEVISPDQAYQDPIAQNSPKTLMANQGLIAAIAVEKGVKPSQLSHPAIEETQIDQLLLERSVFKKATSPE